MQLQRDDLTIIYYSSNQEKPGFEQKVMDNLKKVAGDIPIISVTHRPVDLGTNICVGEQPVCYSSEFKQILIGLKEAKTEWCIAAESDCLYPPDYFTFTPPLHDQVYRYTNLYVHFDGRDKFWKKTWVEAAQMADRQFWIDNIERVLEGQSGWEPHKVNPPFVFNTKEEYAWTGENPICYCKTHRGIGFKTGFEQGSVDEIKYWGTAKSFKDKYLE
jgi:hypothetical protein